MPRISSDIWELTLTALVELFVLLFKTQIKVIQEFV